MIDDLDKSISELLRLELPASIVSQVGISFAAPDNQFPPTAVSLPAIDLFLYDLQENRELRSSEWVVERNDDGSAARVRPPIRLDCSYLITAWASTSSSNPAQDEHRILGEVLKVLVRHPSLPDAILQGTLKGQLPPLPTTTLQPGRLQSLGEFWQALGGKPKVALTYTVTIALEVSAPVAAGAPVVDKILKFKPGVGA